MGPVNLQRLRRIVDLTTIRRMRIAAATAAVLMVGALPAPVASADPGVWPDCEPSPDAMAECTMPPTDPCTIPGTLSGYRGMRGGAFVCTASGQWAWRDMGYTGWLEQRCSQLAEAAGQSC